MTEQNAIRIVEEGPAALEEYATVPIAFETRSRLRAEPMRGGLDGLRLVIESLTPWRTKDYDAIDGEGPTRWALRWNLRNWGILSAFYGDYRIGGAAVAWNTEGVDMLEGRSDLGVLWDLRVRPDWRRKGVGTGLFSAAAGWARSRGCKQLKVETQNTNVAACWFYAAQGCTLGAIHRFAYPAFPDEAMLLWYLDL